MIQSIIKKLFFKQKQQTVSVPIQHNTIMFWIGDDDLPYVKFYISDTAEESVPLLANMLYDINHGKYTSSILDLIIEMSSQDSQISNYSKLLIQYWKKITDDNYLDYATDPYIKPSSFNNSATPHE